MGLFDSKRKVLVIEDEPDIAEALKARLQLEGYEVQTAADGPAGIEKARADNPNFIVLDVMMPKINGYDVCKILKSENATKAIPILILTALPHMDDVEKALQAGADDFLNKPYTNDRLMQKVHKFLPKKT